MGSRRNPRRRAAAGSLLAAIAGLLSGKTAAADAHWALSRASLGLDVAEYDRTAAGGSLTASALLEVATAKGPWSAGVAMSRVRIFDPRQPDGARGVRAGWGDLLVTGGYRLDVSGDSPASLGVTALLKLPTAGRAIGSGRADGGLQLDLAAGDGPLTAFAAAGQWVTGKNDGQGMQNPAYMLAGAQWTLPGGSGLGAYGFYRERTYRRAGNLLAAVPYLMLGLLPGWQLTVYGQVGLGPAAGQEGGGIRLSVTRF
jgi:hypothetical protein